ncbi:hypothetical protein ScPMuIL_008302 [Solemya velum]
MQYFIEVFIQIVSILQPILNEIKNFEWRNESEHLEQKADFTSSENDDVTADKTQDDCLAETPQSEHSSNGVVQLSVEQKLHGEIELFINLILRDFIQSWYKTIGSNPDILDECSDILHSLSSTITSKISGLNNVNILKQIIIHFCHHIKCVQLSRSLYSSRSKSKRQYYSPAVSSMDSSYKLHRLSSVEEAFEASASVHPALKNEETEINYVQGVLKLMITKLLTDSVSSCSGANTLLTEILSHNAVVPVFHLISRPDFLYDSLIRILSDETPVILESKTKQDQNSFSNNTNEALNLPVNNNENGDAQNLPASVEDTAEPCLGKVSTSTRSSLDSDVFLEGDLTEKIYPSHATMITNPPTISPQSSVRSDSDLMFEISIDCGGKQKEEAALDRLVEHSPVSGTLQSPLRSFHEDICSIPFNTESRNADNFSPEKSPQSTGHSTIVANTDDRLSESPSQALDVTGYSSDNSHGDGDCYPDLDILPGKKGFFIDPEEEGVSATEVFEDSSGLNCSEQLFLFQDVRISDTVRAKEHRSSSFYTLYVVEFEALSRLPDGEIVQQTGCVKRRYREFVNLKVRLDDDPLFKNSLRDVQGPRKLSLPFFNMDKDSIENRKNLLENFLKSLIVKEDICNSQDLREFLAPEGDAHIAFVRKAQDLQVPRIDQMLVRTMSGMLDKIASIPSKAQGVLPSLSGKKDEVLAKKDKDASSTEDNDRIKLVCSHSVHEVDSTLGSYSAMAQLIESSEEELWDSSLDQIQEGDITELALSSVEWQDQILQRIPRLEADGSETPDKLPKEQEKKLMVEEHIPLTNEVLNLGALAVHNSESWICRTRSLEVIKMVLGRTLESFIKKEVDFYTSTEKILYYLQNLREVVWPNGKFSLHPIEERSARQKMLTKKQAAQCLFNFLPGVVKFVIGDEDINVAVSEVIDSLQYEKLNRHLVFTMVDMLLEELFPDLSTQELQIQLLQ